MSAPLLENPTTSRSPLDGISGLARRWWARTIVGHIDHAEVVERVIGESGWSPRYIFMTMMSAGIAVLGLLLSSPAVVIGAMLISPLMSPILGLGFSLAWFDFREMRRSLGALVLGAAVAIAFTALIVVVSPLKSPTAEILARVRPNLFDLLVALFAALAGAFAVIRERGETIVGVAIATALMPPLAAVGYGLATTNMAILGGALALFVTNALTIAVAATIMARFYGFGHHLSERQSWTQTTVLVLVFAAMAVPLGLSLNQIAREALIGNEARSFLERSFGDSARVTQLDIDYDSTPMLVRSVVIAPRSGARDSRAIEAAMVKELGRPLRLRLDQILLDPSAGSLDAQRAEVRQGSPATVLGNSEGDSIARMVAVIAGVAVDDVTLDRDHRRATAAVAELPGAMPGTYRVLEARANAAADGWEVALIPPMSTLPAISFDDGSDALDDAARQAVELAAWEARRWNIGAILVPGLLPADRAKDNVGLAGRRARAVADLLAKRSIAALPAPAGPAPLRLAPKIASEQ